MARVFLRRCMGNGTLGARISHPIQGYFKQNFLTFDLPIFPAIPANTVLHCNDRVTWGTRFLLSFQVQVQQQVSNPSHLTKASLKISVKKEN